MITVYAHTISLDNIALQLTIVRIDWHSHVIRWLPFLAGHHSRRHYFISHWCHYCHWYIINIRYIIANRHTLILFHYFFIIYFHCIYNISFHTLDIDTHRLFISHWLSILINIHYFDMIILLLFFSLFFISLHFLLSSSFFIFFFHFLLSSSFFSFSILILYYWLILLWLSLLINIIDIIFLFRLTLFHFAWLEYHWSLTLPLHIFFIVPLHW